MASLTQWTGVWVDSRSWWWTGRPGVLWFMRSQRVRHDWVSELNWKSVASKIFFNVLRDCNKINAFYENKRNAGEKASAQQTTNKPKSNYRKGENICPLYMYISHKGLISKIHNSIVKKKCQFSSVAQSCPTLCDPMNHSMPGLPVHHQLLESTQTHVHWVGDAIQPSHPLSSPSPPAPNPSQHQSLFQWINSSHEVVKVLAFQLQHHSLQRNPRADLP